MGLKLVHFSGVTGHVVAPRSRSHGDVRRRRVPAVCCQKQTITHDQILVGCGGACMDYLASVQKYPNPDDKIRTTHLEKQGGGNVGNALTGAARLGLRTRILTKVADDAMGRDIIAELQQEGVDTSHVIVGRDGNSPFTYIIVDQATSTRTCIHTPGSPPLEPSEVSPSARTSFLEGASMAYFDARLPQVAVPICRQARASGLPVLVDAEKPREGLDDFLECADYAVTAQGFTQAWTGVSSFGPSFLAAAARLQQASFIIVTLGAAGCAMLDRRGIAPGAVTREVDIDAELEQLQTQLTGKKAAQATGAGGDVLPSAEQPVVVQGEPAIFSSASPEVAGLQPRVAARLVVASAWRLRPEQVVDTTGAGDAFIAAILTALARGLPTDQMLQLAATVAAAKCQALGARTGLPFQNDPRVQAFLEASAQRALA